MEIWKDIPNYEGLYQASSEGRIRSSKGKTTSNAHAKERHWKSRIMKGRGDRYATGKRVSLWKDGKCKDFLVARLVAFTFLGTPQKGYTVNHKDGNRLNNAVSNLEWLSLADNIRHGFDTGLYAASQRSVRLKNRHGTIIEFPSMSSASRFLGKSHGYVSGCVKKGKIAVSADGTNYTIL
jgi:hypothetical protein